MTHVAITSIHRSEGYFVSQKYLSILVRHPATMGSWLPLYFYDIFNFKHPIFGSLGTSRGDGLITSIEAPEGGACVVGAPSHVMKG